MSSSGIVLRLMPEDDDSDEMPLDERAAHVALYAVPVEDASSELSAVIRWSRIHNVLVQED